MKTSIFDMTFNILKYRSDTEDDLNGQGLSWLRII